MNKNIWYISKYVTPPYASKVGSRGFLILREFARIGHQVMLITSDSNHLANPPKLESHRFREKVDGVDVIWLRTLKYKSARSFGRMISWLDFELRLWCLPKNDLPRPDVIIVSSLSLLTIFNGLIMRQRFGCKLVFEVRDIWPMTLIVSGKISSRNPFVRFLGWVERLGYTRSDQIVGTMPNLREHVVEVSGSNRPVFCIPQGVDSALLETPQPLESEFVRQNFHAGKFIVCHAGSIGADNALETLLNCARLMQHKTDIQFLIVGEGYLKTQLEKKYRDLSNLTFAPGVPKAAVQSVLAKVDLLYFAVHKSPMLRFGQSLNKVIDYMLAGKPIVASYSGFPSMINEAECGSYVAAEDVDALQVEIERYAAMPASERAQIGSNGRKWILKNRKFETLAEDYLQVLGIKG